MRIVTPGTVTDEALLEERRDNLLAALQGQSGRYGLAVLDLGSGRFAVQELAGVVALAGELERLRPAELLLPEDWPLPPRLPKPAGVTRRPAWHFDHDSAQRLLVRQFGTRDLSGFGCADVPLAVSAAGALLQYVAETQRTELPHVTGLRRAARGRADRRRRHAPQPRDRPLAVGPAAAHARGAAGPHRHCDGQQQSSARLWSGCDTDLPLLHRGQAGGDFRVELGICPCDSISEASGGSNELEG